MSMQLAKGQPFGRGRALRDRLSSLPGSPLGLLATWFIRSGQRRTLRELAQEGRLLNDVGLTRAQVLREAAKPFWRR